MSSDRLGRVGAGVYDGAGRMTMRREPRLSRKPDIWRYRYDAEDRLISCKLPDGTEWRYAYDPAGCRIAKSRVRATGRDSSEEEVVIRFAWDGTRLAEQTDMPTGVALTWDYEGHKPLTQYERKPAYQPCVPPLMLAGLPVHTLERE